MKATNTSSALAGLDYKAFLEHSYANEDYTGCDSRLEYLALHIFGFTTYDSEMDQLFARKAVEVCAAITHRTTFDYIEDPTNYTWYLVMCNMPFFANRIEWGTSIRGAWWDSSQKIDSCGFYIDGKQVTDEQHMDDEDWERFMEAVIEFAAPEMQSTNE